MPHADLDGLKLHYERTGSGEPELLFVPGWCCDHTAFRRQLDLQVAITVGAGHFHQLEVPERVNAMIERFLVVSLQSADA